MLALDQVVFVPVGEAPHREPRARTPGPRCACGCASSRRAAIRGWRCRASRSIGPGPSYTADTLDADAADESPDDELFLILGADQAAPAATGTSRSACWSWPRWRSPSGRAWSARRCCAGCEALAGADGIEFFDMPRLDVSSSLVRERVVAAGLPIRYLVPDAVADCIETERLYRSSSPAPRDDAAPAPTADRARRIELGGAGRPDRADRLRPQGDRHPRAGPARPGGLHRLLRGLLGQHRAPDQGDPRRRLQGAQGRARACCPAAPRARREARWILLDYLDCVLHVFTPEAREFYRLENLWGDAPQRSVSTERGRLTCECSKRDFDRNLGAIAQLEERRAGSAKVVGSSPTSSIPSCLLGTSAPMTESPMQPVAKAGLIALMAIFSVILWLGIPIGWLWIVSQVSAEQPVRGLRPLPAGHRRDRRLRGDRHPLPRVAQPHLRARVRRRGDRSRARRRGIARCAVRTTRARRARCSTW